MQGGEAGKGGHIFHLRTRKIKRLQGLALYGLATLRALWYRYATPSMQVIIDGQEKVTLPTLMISVLLGRREGGFVLAPQARVDDGLFDYLHAGALSRLEVLRFLPQLAISGPPSYHPKVRQGQCKSLTLEGARAGSTVIDGSVYGFSVIAVFAPSASLAVTIAFLTLQNGLGNEQELADFFGAHCIVGGIAFVCINRLAPGRPSPRLLPVE